MDQLVFYKEGQSLSEQVSSIRFSYVRPYRLHFAREYNQLGLILHERFEGLLFFVTGTLSDTERMRLQFFSKSFPDLRICLISQPQFALDAWKLDVFHFEALPANGEALQHSYRKYVQSLVGRQSDLSLVQDGETIVIPYHQILYLSAEGNYTNIVLSNGKKLLQTKQLGKFEPITEQDINFKRLHRSLIINLKLIKSISSDSVIFFGESNSLAISGRLSTKLKKHLLGR
ncbi:MAG TPA: LytTR family DNA-binding domain-containing protein [Saprospiraceae bacterium]|nr:LytTR family DNA-binding domain-containing protein [Saprospiraceae bacterium]